MTRNRRNFTPRDKVLILRQHLIDRIPISDLCDKNNINPTIIYRWQKEFFENGESVFEKKSGKNEKRLEKKISKLQEKITDKDGVIAEIMEAHIELKKSLGEL